MRILITGGAGYIGSILVNKILTAGTEFAFGKTGGNDYDATSHQLDVTKLTVLDNLMYKQICLTDYCYRTNFEFVYGDVRNKELLQNLVRQHDVIIPLAAIVGFPACDKDPGLARQINLEQIQNIMDVLSKNQCIIFPNTNSGYGAGGIDNVYTEESKLRPISVYGITKCRAEDEILQSRNGIVLRLATVFGVSPRMRLDLLVNDFTYKAVTDGYIILFEQDFKRNYIHVRDVALTVVYMINNYFEHNGSVFNVGLDDANLSKLELAERIKKYVPNFVIKADDFTKDPDKRNYIVSNKKILATGWKPYYSLDDGIQELIKAYKIISNENRRHTNL